MLKRKNVKYLKDFYLKDYLVITFGLSLYTIGFIGFIIPNEVVTGGLAGVNLIVKYLTGVEVWKMGLLINSMLLFIALKILNKQFVIKTIAGVGFLTILFYFGETYLIPYFDKNPPVTDPFLSVIMGGLLSGAGIGFCYSANGTTGGTDIIGFIVTKYFRISLARILLIVDVIIVSSSYIILKHPLEKTILGLILLPVMWSVADMVMNGARQSVQIFIFSKNYAEIATHINTEIKRGCTVLDGMGWYSQTPQKVIVVIVRRTEATSIFRLVESIDPDAFVTQTNIMGVYGKGFDKIR